MGGWARTRYLWAGVRVWMVGSHQGHEEFFRGWRHARRAMSLLDAYSAAQAAECPSLHFKPSLMFAALAFRLAALIPVTIAMCSLCFIGDVAHDVVIVRDDESKSDNGENSDREDVPYALLDDVTNTPSKRLHVPTPPCSVLRRCVKNPRLWLYAMALGGTDAPFEKFSGLWGVAFFVRIPLDKGARQLLPP